MVPLLQTAFWPACSMRKRRLGTQKNFNLFDEAAAAGQKN
jgi:hypothetical protein